MEKNTFLYIVPTAESTKINMNTPRCISSYKSKTSATKPTKKQRIGGKVCDSQEIPESNPKIKLIRGKFSNKYSNANVVDIKGF